MPNSRLLNALGLFIPLVCSAITPLPVMAGSVTAESIWDQNNALERAQNQVPKGRTITGQHCTELQVRESYRYRCTVTFN
ncbi:hypothetical protein [Synechococcus sp. UW140]|uniref:hypothetical protein n=1 Tax=Synechococcus sp. UW140 TaxID=368503 RepID=UPI000E0E5C29|nr:hypothetical protein [Synechococcus sp. UW140]